MIPAVRSVLVLLLCCVPIPLVAQAGPSTLLDQVEQMLRDGRAADAKAAVLPIATREPANARAALLAGRALLALNDNEEATRHFERAVQHEPNSSEYHLWLGRGYGSQAQRASKLKQPGLAKKTKAAWEHAVALDPNNLAARSHLIDFHLQAPGIVGGDRKKALAEAEEIRKRNAWLGYLELARVHNAMNNQQGSEQALIAAVKQFPDSAAARVNLSVHYQNVGRFDYAYQALEPVLGRTPPHAGALYQVGRIGALSGKDLDRAENALRAYLKLTPPPGAPSHAAAHWRIGNILEHRGDRTGARKAYETALQLEPNHAQAQESLTKLKQ